MNEIRQHADELGLACVVELEHSERGCGSRSVRRHVLHTGRVVLAAPRDPCSEALSQQDYEAEVPRRRPRERVLAQSLVSGGERAVFCGPCSVYRRFFFR